MQPAASEDQAQPNASTSTTPSPRTAGDTQPKGAISPTGKIIAKNMPAATTAWTAEQTRAGWAMIGEEAFKRWQQIERQKNRNAWSRTIADIVKLVVLAVLLLGVAIVGTRLAIPAHTLITTLAALAGAAIGTPSAVRLAKKWLPKLKRGGGKENPPSDDHATT